LIIEKELNPDLSECGIEVESRNEKLERVYSVQQLIIIELQPI